MNTRVYTKDENLGKESRKYEGQQQNSCVYVDEENDTTEKEWVSNVVAAVATVTTATTPMMRIVQEYLSRAWCEVK